MPAKNVISVFTDWEYLERVKSKIVTINKKIFFLMAFFCTSLDDNYQSLKKKNGTEVLFPRIKKKCRIHKPEVKAMF